MTPLAIVAGLPDAALFAVASALIAGAGTGAGLWYAARQEYEGLGDIPGLDEDDVGFEMPRLDQGDHPVIAFLKKRNLERMKSRALKKGWVRWHLIGSAFSEPKYVRPKYKEGGNIPELRYKGETYLFPESSMVPSVEDGALVAVHHKGVEYPVNLRDSWDFAIGAQTLSRYLDLRVTSERPGGLGLLSGLSDMDSMDMMRYGIMAVVALFILMELLGGGVL